MGKVADPEALECVAGIDEVSPGYHDVVRAFFELTGGTAEQVKLADLLHRATQQICRLFNCRRCSVYLRDQNTDLFRGQLADINGELDATIKRLVCGTEADGFTREIVATHSPVLIRDATTDSRPVRAAVRDWRIRTILGVPIIAQGEVIGIFFLDEFDDATTITKERQALVATFAELAAVTIFHAKTTEDLRSSAATIARQNKLLRRSNLLEEHITSLALEGSSIQDIASAVTTVTNQPCYIHGTDLRRFATAVPATVVNPPQSALDIGVSRTVVTAVLAKLETGHSSPVVVGPFPANGLNGSYLVAPIVGRGERWGYLVVAEAERRLTTLDGAVVRRATSIAALELSTSSRTASTDSAAREALLHDLLEGFGDRLAMRDRIRGHGLSVDQAHAVVLVKARDPDDSPPPLASVESAFMQAGYVDNLLITARSDGTVAALPALDRSVSRPEAARAIKRLVERAMEILSAGHGVIAAISSACLIPAECAAARAEATNVLGVLTTVGAPHGGTVLTADDLGAGRLILAPGNHAEAARFAQQILGPLLEDNDRTNDLLRTLCVFFEACRSVRRSAAELGVHENTIRYRLARVADITGLDVVGNVDQQLSCQLAILILRLQGRLDNIVSDL